MGFWRNKGMRIAHIVVESFQDYYKAHLLIAMPFCSFKCWKDIGLEKENPCQNSHLATGAKYDISPTDLINRYYLENSITKAVVFGGLEPFDSFEDIKSFIECFRHQSKDDIVIYTGYKENEIKLQVEELKHFPNIIIKFGRFVPDSPSRYDEVLRVTLSSNNQYAVKIS